MVYRATGGYIMNKLFVALMRFRMFVMLTVLLATLFAGITLFQAHASTCTRWYYCPITQRYGQNMEHGVDLWTHGLPIPALRSCMLSFRREEGGYGQCVMAFT